MLLSQFFLEFYVPLRLRGRSQETIRLYNISLRNFGKTIGRPATLEDLTDLNLARHCTRLRSAGRAAATANKDLAQLTAIWRLANKLNHVTSWPTITKEVEPQRTPEAWLDSELERLFRTVNRLRGWVGPNAEPLFWRALLLVCLDTGERVGAVRKLEWSHLSHSDQHGHWLRVPAELRKGSRRDRSYMLNADTAEAIGKLQRVNELVFFWPKSDSYLWIRYSEILRKAGLPHDRRSKFHRLRRTVASVYHAAGFDATEALDHADRRTTQSYLDPRFSRDIQPAQVLAEWLSRSRTRDDSEAKDQDKKTG